MMLLSYSSSALLGQLSTSSLLSRHKNRTLQVTCFVTFVMIFLGRLCYKTVFRRFDSRPTVITISTPNKVQAPSCPLSLRKYRTLFPIPSKPNKLFSFVPTQILDPPLALACGSPLALACSLLAQDSSPAGSL